MLKNNKKLWGIAASLLAAFFYGIAAVLIRIGVVNFTSPIVGAAIASLSGAVVMLPVSARGLRGGTRGNRSDIIYLLLSGVLAALGIMAYYTAMTTTTVAVVASITSANSLVTILLAHLFFNRLERITPRVIIGALVVVAGVILVTLGRNTT